MRGEVRQARDEMRGETQDERRGETRDEARSSVSGGGRMGRWWITCPRRWPVDLGEYQYDNVSLRALVNLRWPNLSTNTSRQPHTSYM